MEKYRYWNILETLPDGWVIDNTTGSPAPYTVFITNGKSVLSGKQERALLKVEAKRDINISKNEIVKHHIVEANELKKMLNSIDTSNKKKVSTTSLPDLFSSVGL